MHAHLLSYECQYAHSQLHTRILSCHFISNCFPCVSHQLTLWVTILSDKLITPHILKKLPPPQTKDLEFFYSFRKIPRFIPILS
jgi:hypothetical protein